MVSKLHIVPLVAVLLSALPVKGESLNADVSGGVTLSTQHAYDDRIKSEMLGSIDLFIVAPYLGGEWTVHAEGSTTPHAGRVAAMIGEANTDAGTALTGDGRGHLQISEIKYLYAFDDARKLTVGVLEVPAYMETADTAIDENTQFMGLSFKHNLSVEFPDFALGMIYQHQAAGEGPLLTLAISSSHGLADNSSASYDELLSPNAAGKGVFTALSSRWSGTQWHSELGAWQQTAPHTSLDGSSNSERNYGVFAILGATVEHQAFDLRFGSANSDVTQLSQFASVTYEWRRPEATYGLGAARGFLSGDAKVPGRENMSQYELYARFTLSERIELTPHFQHIDNSNFDASNTLYSDSLNLIGVRLAAFI